MTYGRDASNVYYDVTNYYFEVKESDNFRKKVVSKDHRPDPIIQIRLLMNNSVLPISYKLFEGNTNNSATLMLVLNDLKKDYGLDRVIVVADKSMNKEENIAYNILHKNGYIYCQTVRGANADLKKYVLSDEGYEVSPDEFKIKSRLVTTKISVENTHGQGVQITIQQKQVVFYSHDYAKRAKYERSKAIDKANKLIQNSKNGKISAKGASKYIVSTPLDKRTRELYKLSEYHFVNNKKISEGEKFDGYYAIVTSELKMPNNEILNAYRSLVYVNLKVVLLQFW